MKRENCQRRREVFLQTKRRQNNAISTTLEELGPYLHFCVKYKNPDSAHNLVKNPILYWTAKTISYSNYNSDQQIGHDFERVFGLVFWANLILNSRILSHLKVS